MGAHSINLFGQFVQERTVRAFRQNLEAELRMDYFKAIAKKHVRKSAGSR